MENKNICEEVKTDISPLDDKDFIYVEDHEENGSDVSAGIKSLSSMNSESKSSVTGSFADVNMVDFEPKMGSSEHGQDVIKLVEEAQREDFYPDYDANDYGRSQSDIGPSDSSSNSDDDESIKRSPSESQARDACVLFHHIVYLGSATVNAPVSELELRRTMSILRDNSEKNIKVILGVSLQPNGNVRLIDPENRTDIASYNIGNIVFWGKGDPENEEKDCLAFNVSHGTEDISYVCHAFKCEEEDQVSKILQSLSQTIKKDKKRRQNDFAVRRGSKLDPNNLTFKFQVTSDIWEEDGKRSYQMVARDKNHFKLKRDLQRKVVVYIEQITNRRLRIERCFGLLLAPGRDVPNQDMHLLQQVDMERRNSSKVVVSGHWDPTTEHWKVLNTDTGKDNRIYMSVAVDLVFADLKEPVRFVQEVKVRVYASNEKFWNPSKPRITEEYTMQLKENFTELGEKFFEKETLRSATDISKAKVLTSSQSSNNSFAALWRSSKVQTSRSESVTSEAVEIVGPEEEDEEPLLSGSGQVERDCTEEEMQTWSDVLQKWADLNSRPAKLQRLIRKGIPDALRGQIWQQMAGVTAESDIMASYACLTNKDSPQEQIILWDVTRTFPAHPHFKDAGGEGQSALYKISKAYSGYDEEVGYCQGLSFLIAALLLNVPEEQAYCLLVKIMYDYCHREFFKNSFERLHQAFYVLDHLMEDYLQDLYLHFRSMNIEVHMFASQWFLTLFTAKFPISLVHHLLDILLFEGADVIFQIALAFLKDARKDLLSQDFEGILKYFRISLPKRYMIESYRKELISTAYSFKISKKRLGKYKDEYVKMKEELELREDPLTRLERENQRLIEDNMRLERGNDDFAYEIVTTQVSMQEVITDREEKLNNLTKESERMRKHLMEAEEEIGRLKIEEARVKEMWRDSMKVADEEKAKRDRIIDDYKQILTRLEASNEELKKDVQEKDQKIAAAEMCESCAKLRNEHEKNSTERNDMLSPEKTSTSALIAPEDSEEQLRTLELELIQTKVALAEEKNRADELEMRLQTIPVDKPWYKKVAISNKR